MSDLRDSVFRYSELYIQEGEIKKKRMFEKKAILESMKDLDRVKFSFATLKWYEYLGPVNATKLLESYPDFDLTPFRKPIRTLRINVKSGLSEFVDSSIEEE